MIRAAEVALEAAGLDTSLLQVLVRVCLPPGYRAMSLEDGAALGEEAFTSQAMLNHVLEEELRHLQQKARDPGLAFGPGTAKALEDEINEGRRFPAPDE